MQKFIVGEVLEINAANYADKTALVFNDRRTSWKELDTRANRTANMLLDHGFAKGDRIAVLSQNCDEYMVWYFGCAKAGIILVPLNYRLADGEMINLLNHAEPRGMVVGEEYVKTVAGIRDRIPPEFYFGIGEASADWAPSARKAIETYSDLPPKVRVEEDDPFCIMYTSGTTGLPKGAVSSHRNYVVNCLSVMHAQGLTEEDVNLVCPPLYHAGALFHSLSHMFLGCTHVIMKSFDIRAILETIQKEKATSCLMIPTMLNFLLRDPDFERFDTSSMTRIFYGGGPMPLPLLEMALGRLEGVQFTQGYGLTETLEATFLLPEDHVIRGSAIQKERLASAGRRTPLYEVKVVDGEGRDAPCRTSGEIWVRGPSVIRGYWRDPEQTGKTVSDGWFKTGDIGMMDEGGYFYILDREKDMIISGGENIYTKEVEDILHSHPAILEAAVIGVPDPQWGENVKAVVVLRDGAGLSEEEVITFCQERLARYKRPKSVSFVPELPKNPSGKILKRDLRKRYRS